MHDITLGRWYIFQHPESQPSISSLFSLIPLDGKTKIPERVWDNQVKIWQAVFDIMVNVSPAEFSFVLTNYLSQHKNDDIEHFGIIEGVAKSREAVFVPVRMHIEVEEHKKRISVPERTIRHKMTDKEAPSAYDQEDQIISIAHENLLDLDVTNLSAEAAANQILSFVGNILAKRSPA